MESVCPRCQRPALVAVQSKIENSWRTYLLRVGGAITLFGVIGLCADTRGFLFLCLGALIFVAGLFFPATAAGPLVVQCTFCGLALPQR
jgi:hypothetical protein